MEKEIILDIPYYSEFDPIDGSTEHIEIFKRRSCGIVSVKMVLDFWASQKKVKKVTLKELIKLSLHHKAYSLRFAGRKGKGWVHSGIARTLQDLDFNSWRRMWFMRKSDLRVFSSEGLFKSSLKYYYAQISNEYLNTFKESIDKNEPFLVSVFKDLGQKKSPHLIVVTGYRLNSKNIIDGFFVNDPHNPKNGAKARPLHKNQFISVKEFDKIWRKRAIFMSPKD